METNGSNAEEISKENTEATQKEENSHSCVLCDEGQELLLFTNDLRKADAKYFKYLDYVNWAKSNERPIINQGKFNALILTRFGFAWSRDKGYELRL